MCVGGVCVRCGTRRSGLVAGSASQAKRSLEGWLDNPTLSSDTNPTPPRHPDTTRHPTARQLRQPNVCEDVCTLARLTRQTRHTPTAPTARQTRQAGQHPTGPDSTRQPCRQHERRRILCVSNVRGLSVHFFFYQCTTQHTPQLHTPIIDH